MSPGDLKADKAKSAVVLLSGGLDSTVALAEILTRCPVPMVLTFDYGQRAARPELAAAKAIAKHYQLEHRIIPLPWLADLVPHSLRALPSIPDLMGIETSAAESVLWSTLDQEELYDVNRVWVPNRNGVFLNIAASFAEAAKADAIVFGANAEEGESFPDNTPAFRDALTTSLSYSTLNGVKVETPVGHLHKRDIVVLGQSLGVPFNLIWSCYEGAELPCNACPSCLRLKAAKHAVL